MAANNDDEDSIPSLSEQTNRPADVALHQQRINAWHPILDPVWVLLGLLYLGVIMVPVGIKMRALQAEVVEDSITYDGFEIANPVCGINETYNARRKCNVTLTALADMAPPVLVYYQLTNFHQNHRKYYQSMDLFQLYGSMAPQETVHRQRCEPLNILGNITLNPCGMVANTFFNDQFRIVSGQDSLGQPLELIEEGIAWKSDLEFRYNQPEGFTYEECPSSNATDGTCDPSCCDGASWSCQEPYLDPKSNTCYRYFYPNDDTTQYLYETYPNIISPLEGVTNEHFIVWMRVAPLNEFRKLYGWINQGIRAGSQVVFEIEANYVVTRFRGSKTLVMTTTSIFGGRNVHAWTFFCGMGGFCILAGLFFLVKHTFRPRKLADRSYLHFKEE